MVITLVAFPINYWVSYPLRKKPKEMDTVAGESEFPSDNCGRSFDFAEGASGGTPAESRTPPRRPDGIR